MPALDNAYALVVGIANYQHVRSLPSTVLQDATDIAALLADPAHGAYPPGQVTLLRDGEATRTAILAALADLTARSSQDSIVSIYLSCHGGHIDDGPHAGAYLLPVDTVYTLDQLPVTAISGDEFTRALQGITARKVAVFFDCCHAGGIGQPKDAAAPPITAGLPDRLYDTLKAGRGRFILASSREDEESWVHHGDANSLFTKYLLEGLRGGIASDDGMVRIFGLFEYVQPRVTAAQANQHPLFKADLEENFPVALYLGGQKGVVPKDEQGFQYDAYISYVDQGADSDWVWATLLPRLEAEKLRVVVSGESDNPGVARVVNVERGMMQAKRTIVVLTPTYLRDNVADFENTLGQTLGIQEGTYRLLPVVAEPVDQGQLPVRLSMLSTLDLTNPARVERGFARLVQALQGPLPRQFAR
jgi:Caspase domain/TIR domain